MGAIIFKFSAKKAFMKMSLGYPDLGELKSYH